MQHNRSVSLTVTSYITVSAGKLLWNFFSCKACHEKLSRTSYVRNIEHETEQSRLLWKEAKERDIAVAFAESDQQCHPVGETLAIQQCMYHFKVVENHKNWVRRWQYTGKILM